VKPSRDLRADFGDIDIYLFDQLLRGRFDDRQRVLDAGCGRGRNLRYLLRSGFDVFGIDQDPGAIASVRTLADQVTTSSRAENFVVGEVDSLPWPDLHFDAVISSAVLHFATDPSHFGRMLEEMWRVLLPRGFFFARMASTIGLEAEIDLSVNRRATLPDGTERFLVDEELLERWVERLDAQLLDPIKTTNVQNLRCMTTWVLQKRG